MKYTLNTELTLLSPNEQVQVPVQILYESDDDADLLPSEIHLTYNDIKYIGKGTDYLWVDTFADLQKKLPNNMQIACCMTCRHGNMCPFGNGRNELFCTKDIVISQKWDMVELFEKNDAYNKRETPFCHYCADFVYQSDDYYTYNDFLYQLQKQ